MDRFLYSLRFLSNIFSWKRPQTTGHDEKGADARLEKLSRRESPTATLNPFLWYQGRIWRLRRPAWRPAAFGLRFYPTEVFPVPAQLFVPTMAYLPCTRKTRISPTRVVRARVLCHRGFVGGKGRASWPAMAQRPRYHMALDDGYWNRIPLVAPTSEPDWYWHTSKVLKRKKCFYSFLTFTSFNSLSFISDLYWINRNKLCKEHTNHRHIKPQIYIYIYLKQKGRFFLVQKNSVNPSLVPISDEHVCSLWTFDVRAILWRYLFCTGQAHVLNIMMLTKMEWCCPYGGV